MSTLRSCIVRAASGCDPADLAERLHAAGCLVQPVRDGRLGLRPAVLPAVFFGIRTLARRRRPDGLPEVLERLGRHHRMVPPVGVGLDRLASVEGVEAAWWTDGVQPAGLVIPPGGGAGAPGDPERDHPGQGWLELAPRGLGGRWSLLQRGLDGAGASVGVVGLGWLGHDDLPPLPPVVPEGALNLPGQDHGTQVLGIVFGRTREDRVLGLAPGSRLAALASPARLVDGVLETDHVATAILAAVLEEVDVLLLELQRGGLPVEVDPLDRLAIRAATMLGVTVVAPAGNGRVDLDAWTDPYTGRRTLAPCSGEGEDSGAVLVGAIQPRRGFRIGNHGRRVDCHAWGDAVVTTSRGPHLRDPRGVSTTFNGTSAAAAQVAAVAAVVQGHRRASGVGPLAPAELRELLRRPLLGTRPPPEAAGIGDQPDLESMLGLGPDQGGVDPPVPRVRIPRRPCGRGREAPGGSPAVFYRDGRHAVDPGALISFFERPHTGLHEVARTGRGHVYAGVHVDGRCEEASVLLAVHAFPAATIPDLGSLREVGSAHVEPGRTGGRVLAHAWSWAPGPGAWGLVLEAWCSEIRRRPLERGWVWWRFMDAARRVPGLACSVSFAVPPGTTLPFAIGGDPDERYVLRVHGGRGGTLEAPGLPPTRLPASPERLLEVRAGPATLTVPDTDEGGVRLSQWWRGRVVGGLQVSWRR